MAEPHLTALSSPEFPQVLTSSLEQQISRTLAIVDEALDTRPDFIRCDFCDEHVDCKRVATVHHLTSEHEFCLDHFMEVERG